MWNELFDSSGSSSSVEDSMAMAGPQHELLFYPEQGSTEALVHASSASSHLLRFLSTTTTANMESDDNEEATANDQNPFGVALSYIFLFFLIFGLSATVEMKNLQKQLSNRFAIGTGVFMQFIFMPLLGWLAVLALQNQPGWTREMGISLLVVTSSPGGSYSNWWCSTFNADLALSVAMTTVSSILSIGMLPANLLLYTFLAYGRDQEESVVEALNFSTLFLALGVVLTAILTGLLAGYHLDTPHFHQLANRLGTFSGILLVLFGFFLSSGAEGAENNFWNQDWAFYIGVAFPCLVGICLANILSRSLRLAPPETVAISIECCYQNTGIATSVAIAMYDNVEQRAVAVAVPLFYGVVEAVAIFIYCVWAWKVGWTKAPADERLCVVVTKTYEVVDEDNNNDQGGDDDDDGHSHAPENDDDEEAGDFYQLGRGDSSTSVSTRFADETTTVASSSVAQQQQEEEATRRNSHPTITVPFWQRIFRRESASAAAAHQQDSATTAQTMSPLSSSASPKPRSFKSSKRSKSGASPNAPLMMTLTEETALDDGSPGSKSVDTTTGSYYNGCPTPARNRSMTVETTASSNTEATTPGRAREVVSLPTEENTAALCIMPVLPDSPPSEELDANADATPDKNNNQP